jgi:hypothetical protein
MTMRFCDNADAPDSLGFLVPGHTWPMAEHLTSPRVGAIGALRVAGVARPGSWRAGDYAYRPGVLRWAVPEGVWSLIRVR